MRTPLKEFVRGVLYRDTSRKSKWVFIDMRRLGEKGKKIKKIKKILFRMKGIIMLPIPPPDTTLHSY
jgi:hypothetical protein